MTTSEKDLKKTGNKILLASLIVLIITFVLGLLFCVTTNVSFAVSETIFGKMAGVDPEFSGAGEYVLLTMFLGFFVFMGEASVLILIFFAAFLIPVCINFIILLLRIIGRLFQIGDAKKWKNITTIVFMIISFVIQLLLDIYLITVAFSGFSLNYIFIYVMILINLGSLILNLVWFIKGIKELKNS